VQGTDAAGTTGVDTYLTVSYSIAAAACTLPTYAYNVAAVRCGPLLASSNIRHDLPPQVWELCTSTCLAGIYSSQRRIGSMPWILLEMLHILAGLQASCMDLTEVVHVFWLPFVCAAAVH
jgi:hypothetical protein